MYLQVQRIAVGQMHNNVHRESPEALRDIDRFRAAGKQMLQEDIDLRGQHGLEHSHGPVRQCGANNLALTGMSTSVESVEDKGHAVVS